jgi:tetratricopeptide (TPR) repeat protein
LANARQKPKTKKQMAREALDASLDSQWEEALRLNDEFLARFPRNADALNRKGRAYIELGRYTDARDAYAEALKADPANMIARRNLQRLEILYNRSNEQVESSAPSSQKIPRAAVFIQETGKTWLDELADAADAAVLADVSPGEKVVLSIEEGRTVVRSEKGVRLGELELRIGTRIARLTEAGHEFEAYALGQTAQSLRVIIREIARPEGSESILTFPRQEFASQDLLREREQLFLREEGDFDFGDEEDEEVVKDDEELEESDDEAEEDASAYIDESVISDDEEEQM